LDFAHLPGRCRRLPAASPACGISILPTCRTALGGRHLVTVAHWCTHANTARSRAAQNERKTSYDSTSSTRRANGHLGTRYAAQHFRAAARAPITRSNATTLLRFWLWPLLSGRHAWHAATTCSRTQDVVDACRHSALLFFTLLCARRRVAQQTCGRRTHAAAPLETRAPDVNEKRRRRDKPRQRPLQT